jgi:uncharacterized protein
MGATAHLLELQALDLAIDRLRARVVVLSSGSELAAARAEADAAEARLGELRLQIDTLDRDASVFEHEIDSLTQKAKAEDQRRSSGAVANPRELDAIGHEIDNLQRRIHDREDELLVIMERRETLDGAVREAGAENELSRAAANQARAAGDEELVRVEQELAEREAERPGVVAGVEPETLELYEELRPQKKGVGAAALVDNVCQGCHEQLSSVELDRVRHTDGIARCEYCRRILVL